MGVVAAVAVVAACSGGARATGGHGSSSDPAIRSRPDLHYSDLHNSAARRLLASGDPGAFREERWPVNLHDLVASGAEAIVLSVGSVRFEMREENALGLDELIDRAAAFKDRAPTALPELRFAGHRSAEGADPSSRRISWVFGLEGSHVLAGHLDRIPDLWGAGFRVVGIGHDFEDVFVNSTVAADADVRDEPRRPDDRTELTAQGRELVERAIRAGMVIDVSHLRRKSFWQVVEIAGRRGRLIASHSNARALCDDDRNLDDAQARAVADAGGLVGVSFHAPLLAADPGAADVETVVDHIRHWVDLLGVEHVALGTDFEGRIRPPEGLHRLADLAALDEALARRGFNEKEIYAIMSGNVRYLVEGLGGANRRRDRDGR